MTQDLRPGKEIQLMADLKKQQPLKKTFRNNKKCLNSRLVVVESGTYLIFTTELTHGLACSYSCCTGTYCKDLDLDLDLAVAGLDTSLINRFRNKNHTETSTTTFYGRN